MGADGWVIDNVPYPDYDANAGVRPANVSMGPAQGTGRDSAHGQNITQAFPAPGNGRDIYGSAFDTIDLHAWKSSTSQPDTAGSDILNARYDTSNWPTPYDSTTVAPLLPDIRSTDAIPMRRMRQDDRPMYRQVALPGANIRPSGSTYNPQTESNVFLKTRTPIPGSYTAPTDPSVSQDALSQSVIDSDDYVSVGDWQ